MPRTIPCDTEEEAEYLVTTFNGYELRGHSLSLCSNPGPPPTVFMTGLPPDATMQELNAIFAPARRRWLSGQALLPMPKKKPEFKLISQMPPEVGCRVELHTGLAGLVTAWKDDSRTWLVEPETPLLRRKLGPRIRLAASLTEEGEPIVELSDSSVCLANGRTGMVSSWQPETKAWRVDWDDMPGEDDEDYDPDMAEQPEDDEWEERKERQGRPDAAAPASEDEAFVAEKIKWRRILAAELGAEKEHWEKLLAAEQDAAAEQMESLEQEYNQKLKALQVELDKLRFQHKAQDEVVSKLRTDLEKERSKREALCSEVLRTRVSSSGEAHIALEALQEQLVVERDCSEKLAAEMERAQEQLREERLRRETAEQERTDADLAAAAHAETKEKSEEQTRKLLEELSGLRFEARQQQLRDMRSQFGIQKPERKPEEKPSEPERKVRRKAKRKPSAEINAETLHRLFCEGSIGERVCEAGSEMQLRLVPEAAHAAPSA